MSYLHPLRDKSEHATSKFILIAGHLLLAVTVLAVWPLPTFAEEDAVQLLRQQAEAGDSAAQFNLGLMYANGEGVPKDLVMAYMWINLAAATGGEHIETFKAARDRLESLMTRDQIAEAQKQSREWLEQRSEKEAEAQQTCRISAA